MDKGKNRALVAAGMAGGVLLLLAAFLVVWLMPRDPGTGNAQGDNGAVIGSPPQAQPVVKTGDAALIGSSQMGGALAAPGLAPLSDTPHITVRGTGVVAAKPDLVNLQIGVQVQKNTLDEAQNEANTKMDAAMKQLNASGIAEADISTAQYSVEPVMDYSRNNEPPRLVGFRVTNILNVKIRDITKAGKIIDEQVKAGANTVYGLSFGFSDPTALMRQAREAAMQDAKAKADQLASLGGVTLGTPIVIEDGGSNVPPPVMAAEMAGGAARDMSQQAPTQINPGQQEVRAEVSVSYGLK